MNLDIENNTTLNRKSTYIQSNSDISNKNKGKQIINIEHSNKIVSLPNSIGLYARPNNFMDHIDNYVIINRTIQINSSNRNINYFKNPFYFITYVANNQIVNNGPLKAILSNGSKPIFKTDPKNDVYLTPRIGTIIPDIYKINLKRIIVPNYFTINQLLITNNTLYTDIGNYLMNALSSNSGLIYINNILFIGSPSNIFITIVNFVVNKKINIIINYNPSIVVSYIYIYSVPLLNPIISTIYQYTVDFDSLTKEQRLLNLNIKELDDVYDNTTGNIITTFRLFPKSIKNNFLYADTKKIKKLFDKVPVKLNKISIQITDNNNVQLKVNFLDFDIVNPSNLCICSPEHKDYSCPCSYILHPLNPKYQTYMFFNFEYKYMIINEKTIANINSISKNRI